MQESGKFTRGGVHQKDTYRGLESLIISKIIQIYLVQRLYFL